MLTFSQLLLAKESVGHSPEVLCLDYIKTLIRYEQSSDFELSQFLDYVKDLSETARCTGKNHVKLQKPLGSFLLSLSNVNHGDMRVLLMEHFCFYTRITEEKMALTKIIHRFGSTVLSEKFQNLRSSEDTLRRDAEKFLLSTLPVLLSLDAQVQRHLSRVLEISFFTDAENAFSLLSQLGKKLSQTEAKECPVYLIHLQKLLLSAFQMKHLALADKLLSLIEDLYGNSFKRESMDLIMNAQAQKGKMLKLLKSHGIQKPRAYGLQQAVNS